MLHLEGNMPQKLTYDLFAEVYEDFDKAETAVEVRAVFKKHGNLFGWKRLCRIFVNGWGLDEMWLHEQERIEKGG
jgi:hypothetical protein